MYKEHNFGNIAQARAYAKKMKRMYGYTPQIFRVIHRKKRIKKYVVVKPSGLIKI